MVNNKNNKNNNPYRVRAVSAMQPVIYDIPFSSIVEAYRDCLSNKRGTNSYTIEKNGVHKMIFQSAWKENGDVAGLCEISMIIPAELPHYVRGTQS